jgi:hypothetical protein
MAKISANGATTRIQVKAHKKADLVTSTSADGLVHLTLTLTSDGRLLQKITHRYKSQVTGNTWQGGGGYTVKARLRPARMDELGNDRLRENMIEIATYKGYEIDD